MATTTRREEARVIETAAYLAIVSMLANRASVTLEALDIKASELVHRAFKKSMAKAFESALAWFLRQKGGVTKDEGVSMANILDDENADWYAPIKGQWEDLLLKSYIIGKHRAKKSGAVKRISLKDILKLTETIAVAVPGVKGAKVDLSMVDQSTLEWLAKDANYWYTTGDDVLYTGYGDKISKIISASTEIGYGRMEVAELLKKAFPEVLDSGYRYFDVVSSAGMVRSSSCGAVRQFEEAGIHEYEWFAMGDDRMCPTCGALNGKIFQVQNAASKVNSMMMATSPDAVKEIMPWKSFSAIDGLDSEELEAIGVSMPPVHGRCRCVLNARQ
jgi:SPP1 gp7 family putative phage head morphogenesis protein